MKPQYLQLGPCYGWRVYGYERNNGWLGRTAHNGHSGGELEATMMRSWWKVKFVQDLVHILFVLIVHELTECLQLTNLESFQTSEDQDSIDLLKKN